VVAAIRYLYAYTGRPVELFGWSQGASTLPRWALRWWPDIRPMVASLVGLAPDNEYGTDTVSTICTVECFPAAWQETRRLNGAPSNFIAAMNSGQQTFPGIAYTDIWSLTDEVAGLNIGPEKVSPLPPAPNVLNVSTQSICPLQAVEHLTIPASSAAYAVAMAALATPGQLPDMGAINPSAVCASPRAITGMITSEPPLKCYVTASCAGTAASG
jgi:hypothetical protein